MRDPFFIVPAVIAAVVGSIVGIALILYLFSVFILGAPHGF